MDSDRDRVVFEFGTKLPLRMVANRGDLIDTVCFYRIVRIIQEVIGSFILYLPTAQEIMTCW